jgi:predicted Zn-dependent protease with MMP-like domain
LRLFRVRRSDRRPRRGTRAPDREEVVAAEAPIGVAREECDGCPAQDARIRIVAVPQASEVTRPEFERQVSDALATIPGRFRDAMRNIAIVVEDEPDPAMLRELECGPNDTLFGLYQGTPLTERSWGHGNVLPDRITLFQGPHEREASDDGELVASIGETLIHEIGHYFGLSEEEIEAIEERYWRGAHDGDQA